MSLVHTLVGHTNYVWSASFSLDGSHVVTCSTDETARVWNLTEAAAATTVGCLKGHNGVVRACQFSPDSRLIATASWDKTVCVYLSHNFQLAYLLRGHKYGVTDCKFSPSGNQLATSSWDDTVALWDVETGQQVRTLSGHTSAVSSCSFGVGGSVIASASWDGTVRVWDLAQESSAICLLGHEHSVYDVACSPVELGILASCGGRGVLALWDARNRAIITAVEKGVKETNCVCFSPNGTHLATGNDYCEILIWNLLQVKASSFQAVAPVTLSSHSGVVYGVAYGGDGMRLATSSSDRTCKIWDLTSCARSSQSATAFTTDELADTLASTLTLTSTQR